MAPQDRERGATVALVPAGGELWEDFLDTIGVSLQQFCTTGPGGWMLGYIEALASVGIRTVVVFYSARVTRVTHYANPDDGSVIAIIPVSHAYVRTRNRFPGYYQTLMGAVKTGLVGRAGQVVGAVASHLSTPLRATAKELRARGCKAIICQEYEYFRFDACLLLGRMLSIPVYATFQGSTSEPNVLSRVWKRPLVPRATGLIVAARAEAERVRRRYGPKVQVAEIPNPLNVETWRARDRDAARRDLGIAASARVAVWHGRVSIHSKGLDLLLAAWRKIRDARPGRDVRLVMIGTGDDAAEFGAMLERTGATGITWRNEYVTDFESIRTLLSAGDVYAFPSRHEGFPVAPIEAMACGLPLVAADASGVSEIVGRERVGGILVPVGDVDALAAALGRLIDDPALSVDLGRGARRRAEEMFSVEAVGRQLGALLDLRHGAEAPR
jgi:starch synthase